MLDVTGVPSSGATTCTLRTGEVGDEEPDVAHPTRPRARYTSTHRSINMHNITRGTHAEILFGRTMTTDRRAA